MPKVVTWISRHLLERLTESAVSEFPLETGGLILGYWANSREAVVADISSAGPNAQHFRYSYRPDYEHDIAVAARAYKASGGTNTYLGDWHTHPNTTRPYLSFKDLRALHRIANSVDARAPRPLGMVCAGSGSQWRPKIWVGEEAVTAFGIRFLVAVPTTIVRYD